MKQNASTTTEAYMQHIFTIQCEILNNILYYYIIYYTI